MSEVKNDRTDVVPLIHVREYWKREKWLFGLLTWKRIIRAEKIGESLNILCERTPVEVFINDVKYVPVK